MMHTPTCHYTTTMNSSWDSCRISIENTCFYYSPTWLAVTNKNVSASYYPSYNNCITSSNRYTLIELYVQFHSVQETTQSNIAANNLFIPNYLSLFLSGFFNTSPGEGLRITRPWGGQILPPGISAPRKARNTKLGGRVGPHKNLLWWKFSDPRSTSSRLNDVINAKFLHFLIKRAALCFRRFRAQTKTDSFDLKKSERCTMNWAIWCKLSALTTGQPIRR